MKPSTAVVIGAGNRGRLVYAHWAHAHPDRLRVVAVAEPDDVSRSAVATDHGIAPERVFRDWAECLSRPRLADVAIIATTDTLHVEPALAAIARGYDVLLEKPIAPTPAECVRVVEAAEAAGCLLQIGHVLRYTPFYEKIHEIVRSGVLGELVHVDLKEHVAQWHMTHSFVRGRFRNRSVAAPILLAKSCHDLDLLTWLVDRPALRVASFGSLSHYRPERAPAGAPLRCSDGCPVQASCPHDAVAFYTGPEDAIARVWPWCDVSPDPSRAARRRALETDRYGRCVFHCDNDVLDHQVVALEFEGGVTASFGLHGLAANEQRTIRLTGTRGELRGLLDGGIIEVSRAGALGVDRSELEGSVFGHFGGDPGLMAHFSELLQSGSRAVRASGRAALESHLIGFAAERARETGQVVAMQRFRAGAYAEAGLAPR
ncbi:MAG: putative oxidoreductase [Deltaproteobacteria bacterium]|nr:putative oxidoreductase [Deltaproteobacteria bacterium]